MALPGDRKTKPTSPHIPTSNGSRWISPTLFLSNRLSWWQLKVMVPLITSILSFTWLPITILIIPLTPNMSEPMLKEPELKGMEELIHDHIFLTIQLTVDEVENAFEKLDRKMFAANVPQRSDIEDQLKKLATFCIRTEINNKS
jgi:hypothetical protein